jgi:hypothetical protein
LIEIQNWVDGQANAFLKQQKLHCIRSKADFARKFTFQHGDQIFLD